MDLKTLLLVSMTLDSQSERMEEENKRQEVERIRQLKEAIWQAGRSLKELKQEAEDTDPAELEQALRKLRAAFRKINIRELEELEYKDLYHDTSQALEAWLLRLEEERARRILDGITPECGSLPWEERYRLQDEVRRLERYAALKELCREKYSILEASFRSEELEFIRMLHCWKQLKEVVDWLKFPVRELEAYCRCRELVPEFRALYAGHPGALNVPRSEVEKVLERAGRLLEESENRALIGKFLRLMAETNEKKMMARALKWEELCSSLTVGSCMQAPELTGLPGFPQFRKPREISRFLAALDRLKALSPTQSKEKLREELERYYHPAPVPVLAAPATACERAPVPAAPATACERVSVPVPVTAPVKSGRRKRSVFVLLAVFLPGVQFFYLGRPGMGTLLILLEVFSCGLAWPLVGSYSVLDALFRRREFTEEERLPEVACAGMGWALLIYLALSGIIIAAVAVQQLKTV